LKKLKYKRYDLVRLSHLGKVLIGIIKRNGRKNISRWRVVAETGRSLYIKLLIMKIIRCIVHFTNQNCKE